MYGSGLHCIVSTLCGARCSLRLNCLGPGLYCIGSGLYCIVNADKLNAILFEQDVFDLADIKFNDWLLVIGTALAITFGDEMLKWCLRAQVLYCIALY